MLQTELLRFSGFFIFLIVFSAIFAGLRVEDRAYLHVDSGITASDLASMQNQTPVFGKIQEFGRQIFLLDFGATLAGERVAVHLLQRLLPTLHLALFAVLTGSFAAIFFSLLGVYWGKQWFRNFMTLLANVILSTPVFVAAVLLLVVFFHMLNLFPPGGYESWNTAYVILPGAALGMRVFARMYLFSNQEAYQEYDSAYSMVLRSRGFSEKRIIFHHIFRKIIPVLLIYIILDFSSLLSGAMVVEEIFFFPGIGKSMYSAIRNMDEILLRSLLFYTGLVFYLFNRLAVAMQNRLKGLQ